MESTHIKNADEIISAAEGNFHLIIERNQNETLKKSGASYTGKCPSCGKEKKLSFSPKKQVAKCFPCGFSAGSPVKYIMEANRVTYPEALKLIAEFVNVSVIYSIKEEVAETLGKSKPKKNTSPKPTMEEPDTKVVETFASFEIEQGAEPSELPSKNIEKVEIPKEKPAKKKGPKGRDLQFFEIQLLESGLTVEGTQSKVVGEEKGQKWTKTINRYFAGHFNPQTGELLPGEDMVISYVGLNREIIHYRKKTKLKKEFYGPEIPFYRIRHQFPEQYTDKNGKPKKYESPWSSGVVLYYPELFIKKYEKKTAIKTLYIDEGEKKADKACLHGFFALGIMGIQNIVENKNLHPDFNVIIHQNQIQNVVFRVDADWQTKINGGENASNSIDLRAKSFLAAVRTFQKYFNAFNEKKSHLRLFFSYVKPNQNNEKGVDDLLVGSLKGKEEELYKDSESAMFKGSGEGKYVNCIDITGYSEYKLQELFHLQSPDDFIQFHKERIKELGETFYFSGVKYRLTESATEDGKIYELAQPLAPQEIFWQKRITKDGKESDRFRLNFNRFRTFMVNKGIGMITLKKYPYSYDLIKLEPEHKTVYKFSYQEAKRWVIDFLNAAGELEVTDYLMQNPQIISENNLNLLPHVDDAVPFLENSKTHSYMFYQNSFWEITKEGVKSYPLHTAPGFVYKEQIIERSPTLMEDLPTFEKVGSSYIFNEKSKKFIEDFDFSLFLKLTGQYKPRDFTDWTDEDLAKLYNELAHKMTAIGYLLHDYFDPGCAKMIYLTDGDEHEVGASNGRSGKSLTAEFIRQYLPMVDIDGKAPDLEKDKNWLANVNEQTGVVYVDDLGYKFPIERFFAAVTGVFQVRKMYKDTIQFDRKHTPKFLVSANHGIKGLVESSSARDRVHSVAFSPYFNEDYRPSQIRNRLFFDEWDETQQNMSDNFAAACVHAYLKHNLIQIMDPRIERNNNIQFVGTTLWLWLNNYFFSNPDATDIWGEDCRMDRKDFLEKYIAANDLKNSKFKLSPQGFKSKVLRWCESNAVYLNPFHPIKKNKDGEEIVVKDWGEDWKTGGISYWFFEKEDVIFQKIKNAGRLPEEDLPFEKEEENNDGLPF